MTTRADLYVDQGTDFYASIELTAPTGEDFVISSQNFYSGVRKLYSTTNLFSFDLQIIPGDGNNDLSLSISANDTRNLTPGKYQYDILMSINGGITQKIQEGLLYILPTITVIS